MLYGDPKGTWWWEKWWEGEKMPMFCITFTQITTSDDCANVVYNQLLKKEKTLN